MFSLSPLQVHRLGYVPPLPSVLHDFPDLVPYEIQQTDSSRDDDLGSNFMNTRGRPILAFKKGNGKAVPNPLIVGIVLSGGQAPGGHNVIWGLYEAIMKIHPKSKLIGFCGGPSGIIKNQTIPIDAALLSRYKNQGGFDMLGSGRTKIETPEQFQAAESTVRLLDLDGLVIVGGDDSNTNAAFLAEYFIRKSVKTCVVGVPKTIDGDLQNEFIEISFGFDTACKVYSEIIGNILRDALSTKKYWHFIKLMGRTASHITLECALQTRPNLTLISEEIAQKNLSLSAVTEEIADMICARAKIGKNYGGILIPEGVVESISGCKEMIQELNHIIAAPKPSNQTNGNDRNREEQVTLVCKQLSPAALHCFREIPPEIQDQLLADRDPHGNVRVSKIETERLFISLVEKELRKRTSSGLYSGTFLAQPHFCGYEGRSALPSNFDAGYCYALGFLSALLVREKATGYMSCIGNLSAPPEQRTLSGVPLFSMLHTEKREGKEKTVIRKSLVDLHGKVFNRFIEQRGDWILEDRYSCPGPIQFEGPKEITDSCPQNI